jgi:hypothetical protein
MEEVEKLKRSKGGDLDLPSPSRSMGSPKRKLVSNESETFETARADFYLKNFGMYPLSEFQCAPANQRKYTDLSGLTSDDVGRSVLVQGWLQGVKSFGKNMTFLTLRDGLSTLQCILFGDRPGVCADMVAYVNGLTKESFIDIHGLVQQTPKSKKVCIGTFICGTLAVYWWDNLLF